MQTLITGSSGFVGRQLTRYLQQHTDWTLHGLSRQDEGGDSLGLNQIDLLATEAVIRAVDRIRPELIFHLAGQASVAASFRNPAETLQNNIFSQLNLFEAVRHAGSDPRIIVIGSNEVYGSIQPSDLPTAEETPLRPASPYAVSKATQDLLALQYHLSYNMKTIRMRPFNHIGPGQDERFVVPSFARQIARIEAGLQEPVLRVGNLEAQRDFTDVRDIVRGYYLAALHGVPGEAYNLGSGRALAIRELLDMMLAQSTTHIDVIVDPERVRPVDIPVMICDASRFQRQTGWQPQVALEQTLADVLAEWREKTTSG